MFDKILSGKSAPVQPGIQRAAYKPRQKYFRKQINGNFAVILITEGKGRLSASGRTIDISTGDILFMPAGTECGYMFEAIGTPSATIVTFKLIGEAYTAGSNSEILYINSNDQNSGKIIRMMIDQIAENHIKNTEGKGFLSVSLLYKLIYELYSAKNEKPSARGEIQRGIRYIENNYLEEFEIEDVARICGMCLSLFYKSFKECTGLTPVEYKNRLKINRAIELLTERRSSLDDISKMLNFCNQSYFIRTFKRVTGYTPKQFMSRK